MRLKPWQISTTGAVDGQVLTYNVITNEYAPATIPLDGVQSITAGVGITIDATDPAHPIVSLTNKTRYLPLTTTVGGVPDFVWDDDDQLVFAEEL